MITLDERHPSTTDSKAVSLKKNVFGCATVIKDEELSTMLMNDSEAL